MANVFLYPGETNQNDVRLRNPLVGGTTTYTITPSGGVAFEGAASTSVANVAQVAGGITLSGSTSVRTTKITAVAGGITFASAAPTAQTLVTPVSGGITFGGSALSGYVPGSGSATYTITTAGGIALSVPAVTSYVAGVIAPPVASSGGGSGLGWRLPRQVTPASRTVVVRARVWLAGSAKASVTRSTSARCKISFGVDHTFSNSISAAIIGPDISFDYSSAASYKRSQRVIDEESLLAMIV